MTIKREVTSGPSCGRGARKRPAIGGAMLLRHSGGPRVALDRFISCLSDAFPISYIIYFWHLKNCLRWPVFRRQNGVCGHLKYNIVDYFILEGRLVNVNVMARKSQHHCPFMFTLNLFRGVFLSSVLSFKLSYAYLMLPCDYNVESVTK